MATQFSEVKAVLDTIVANWTTGNGGAPDFSGHGPTFLWDTKEHLLAATGHGFRLIQPAIIGVAGQGSTANLVQDLVNGVSGNPQMPLGGLDSNSNTFLTLDSPEIKTIISWIEGGCQ